MNAYDLYPKMIQIWTLAFGPSIRKSLKYFGIKEAELKDGDICVNENKRFDWIKRFVCEKEVVDLMKKYMNTLHMGKVRLTQLN